MPRPLDPDRMNGDSATVDAGDQILLRVTLERLLRRLPAREYEALCLRFQEDLAYKEVAERLSISVGAVAGLISQGLSRLRALMEAEEN